MPKYGKSTWSGKHPDHRGSRSQCAPLWEVPPFGFSEREEPRPFEAGVCHREQYRPEHLWPGRTWTPDTTSTVRPRCPKRTGGEQVARDPACATLRGLVQALGRLHVVPSGKGVAEQYSATRRAKGQTCTPGGTACTREEHLHHSHNTHRRTHARFQRRIDKVEGQGRTVGGQSQHDHSVQGSLNEVNSEEGGPDLRIGAVKARQMSEGMESVVEVILGDILKIRASDEVSSEVCQRTVQDGVQSCFRPSRHQHGAW